MNSILRQAYKMEAVGQDEAEITMYGEVVSSRPLNWWTGELDDADYIVLDEFLDDLNTLKGKSRVTVRLNSVGGDLYAGIAIYNRLKDLDAEIVTVNDGLAASAGSIIFEAGNVRQVHSGSNLMIHQCALWLYDSYNSKALKEIIKQLDAGNKAAANIYVEATGRDYMTIKTMMDRETWLTGQEIVDNGFADSVVGDSTPITMSLSEDKAFIICNGVRLPTAGMKNIPSGLPVMKVEAKALPAVEKQPPLEDKKIEKDGGNEMDIKTVDELRAAFPDLCNELVNSAKSEAEKTGVEAERARIKGIEAIENAIADKAMVNSAKYETPLTAEQLAFKAMQAQAAVGAVMVQKMEDDNKASGVGEVKAGPIDGGSPVGGKTDKQEVEEILALYKASKNGGKKNG